MKYLIATLIFLVSGFVHSKPLYTIYSGFPKGTYINIAEDIARACPKFQINVEATQGSLQNINSLITTPVVKNGYRLAIVQRDALEAIIGTEPKAAGIYKTITPLYSEEITIIVNKNSNIKTLADLNGKKVASGLPGSGIWFSSNTIKNALSIHWLQIDRTPEESILLVLTGEIDAMVIVGGVPVRLFQELGKTMSDRISMLKITAPELEKEYTRVVIPPGTYLWQDYPVETKATQSILIAAADVPDGAIKELKSCLITNIPSIRKFGHSKWKEIIPNLQRNQIKQK